MQAVSNLSLSKYTPQTFEPLHQKDNFPQVHLSNINKATTVMRDVLSTHSTDLCDLQEVLPKLVDDICLDTTAYEENGATKNDVGKYLLSSLSLPNGKNICLQLFYFLPKQKTVIHDHASNCAFIVVTGEARNRLYNETLGRSSVHKSSKHDYVKGDVVRVNLDQSNIHSLKNNSKKSPLITLHMYEVDGIINQSVKRIF